MTRTTEVGSFSSSSWTYRSSPDQVQGPKEFLLAWHWKKDNTILQILRKMSKDAKWSNNHAPHTITNPPICRPFQKVAIDIVGPLPLTLSKNQFILSYIDVVSWYPEAIPLKKTTAIEVGKALMNNMSRLSVPENYSPTEDQTSFLQFWRKPSSSLESIIKKRHLTTQSLNEQ